MKHERISVKSLSETIGNSTVTVRKALRKLEDAKTVTVEEEKRVRLHDGGYQAESPEVPCCASMRRCEGCKDAGDHAGAYA